MPRIRVRKPSDDRVPVSEIAIGIVFAVVIGLLVAWGVGWL